MTKIELLFPFFRFRFALIINYTAPRNRKHSTVNFTIYYELTTRTVATNVDVTPSELSAPNLTSATFAASQSVDLVPVDVLADGLRPTDPARAVPVHLFHLSQKSDSTEPDPRK